MSYILTRNIILYPYIMRTLKDYLIRGLRAGYRCITRKKFPPPVCECDRQAANDMIYDLLASDKPCMISRIGSGESNCVNNYLCVNSNAPSWKKWWDYISDNTETPWWNDSSIRTLFVNTGVFPRSQQIAERFAERYLEDIPEIDLLACIFYTEKYMPIPATAHRIQFETLLPYFVDRPWTRILKGKRVLVIYPFEQTIHQQYAKREMLYTHPEILPDFELITLKAVQTIAGNKSEFSDWFEALEYMERQIDKIDFDIALIGCGAYGLPLAAYIKRMGKKAVHLGGGVQLLFGILGKRWVVDYPKLSPWHYLPGKDIDIDYTPIFNQHWCYPLPIDTPSNTQVVEGACYWK